MYDYKFEKLWEEPDKWVEHLKPYKAVLTPDFSMYLEMPDSVKLFNTFRNRWCGAYMAEKGLRVIPTVNWGGPSSFDYRNHADQKDFFMAGYNEMLQRLEPEIILCYHEPFPEMRGNIIAMPHASNEWELPTAKCRVDLS